MSKFCKVACLVILSAFPAYAQNLEQAALCALEAGTLSSMTYMANVVRAETNPVKKDSLMMEYRKAAEGLLKNRLDFFGATYGWIGGAPVNLKGGKPYTNWVGKVTNFRSNGIGGYGLSIMVDCVQEKPKLGVWTNIVDDPAVKDAPVISDLNRLRGVLQQVSVGNAVQFSGVITLSAGMARSPSYSDGTVEYSTKIDSIKKR